MFTHSVEDCPVAAEFAAQLRTQRRELAGQWLGRIAERVTISANRIFPSDELLDHVPLLIDGVADYVENPAAEVSVNMPVVAKAMELGALRHSQGFDAYEVLKEYEILGGILFASFARTADGLELPCSKGQIVACGSRLFKAVTIIQAATMTHFLLLADERVAERETRLRAFNRVLSHEIKNRIAAILGASSLLGDMDGLPADQKAKFASIISRNAHEMGHTVDNVLVLSRVETDVRHHRHVELPEAAKEAMREVRDASQSALVDIRIAPGMPAVEVNASVIELCIKNYLSNAIKYSDPGKPYRFAEISAAIEPDGGVESELVIRVRDNGLGVPPDKRERLFEEFFRAHETVVDADGTGLGLSIVRAAARSQGGRAWAEHLPDGSVFALALPVHRRALERTSAASRF